MEEIIGGNWNGRLIILLILLRWVDGLIVYQHVAVVLVYIIEEKKLDR
jgi:hypothetical protein